MSHWSKEAKATIARVVAENPGKDDEELLDLIDAAYPFGMREYWPYKVWLSERRAWRLSRIAPDSPMAIVCGACGADIGKKCREYLNPRAAGEDARWPIGEPRPELDYFHEARLERFKQATNGPLFEALEQGQHDIGGEG